MNTDVYCIVYQGKRFFTLSPEIQTNDEALRAAAAHVAGIHIRVGEKIDKTRLTKQLKDRKVEAICCNGKAFFPLGMENKIFQIPTPHQQKHRDFEGRKAERKIKTFPGVRSESRLRIAEVPV